MSNLSFNQISNTGVVCGEKKISFMSLGFWCPLTLAAIFQLCPETIEVGYHGANSGQWC